MELLRFLTAAGLPEVPRPKPIALLDDAATVCLAHDGALAGCQSRRPRYHCASGSVRALSGIRVCFACFVDWPLETASRSATRFNGPRPLEMRQAVYRLEEATLRGILTELVWYGALRAGSV